MSARAASKAGSLALMLTMAVLLGAPRPTKALAAAEGDLRGGGSTLVNPLMRKWISEYRKVRATAVKYEPTGSGRGIAAMTDKRYDFGCSDAPMNDAELKAAADVGGAVVHVPVTLGAVAVIYNLPEVQQRIRFSGPVLAAIFLGRIKRWNDPELKALNPSLSLPDRPIAAVHRLDSSGTTYTWTEYLAKVSPEWRSEVGFGKIVSWPVGLEARGNEGVAGLVKRTSWSIGYAQVIYGIRQSLQYGSVENAAGDFVEPSPEGITAAAKGVTTSVPEDLRFSITDGSGKGSYPISTATWALAYVRQEASKRRQLDDFLRWVLHEGQQYAEALDFAPLPQDLVERGDGRVQALLDRN